MTTVLIRSICPATVRRRFRTGGTIAGRSAPQSDRGNRIHIATPPCITRDQVDELTDALDRVLTQWEEAMGVR